MVPSDVLSTLAISAWDMPWMSNIVTTILWVSDNFIIASFNFI